MHQILVQKGHVPGPLLGRDFLWFDSLKRPLNPCILGSGWLLKQAFSLVPRPIPQKSPAPISLTWDWTPTRNKLFWPHDESFYSTKLGRLKWLAIGLVRFFFFFVWCLYRLRLLHSDHKNATTERRAWSTTHIKRGPLRVCITNWLLKTKSSFFIPFYVNIRRIKHMLERCFASFARCWKWNFCFFYGNIRCTLFRLSVEAISFTGQVLFLFLCVFIKIYIHAKKRIRQILGHAGR